MSAVTPAVERDIAAAHGTHGQIAGRYGVSVRTVARIRREGPRRATRREAFAEVVGGAWRADCMTDEEWADWLAMNPVGIADSQIAERPCRDCPLGFAAEMRAEGRCNGTPGWHPPADDHEEAEVSDTVTVADVQVNAPCGRCVHEPVCSIKASLAGVRGGVEVEMPKPDPALTATIVMQVDCSHFLAVKKQHGLTGRKLNLTDEERQRRREHLRAASAKRWGKDAPLEATA